MINFSNLLIVAGNARNVGKTTLVKAIIRRFSEDFPVVGLKVSSIRPDENSFHGNHPVVAPVPYSIEQETDLSGLNDTSGMLLAGAVSSWYIRTKPESMMTALNEFRSLIPADALIVAESRALRSIVEPGVLIVIKRRRPWVGIKPIDDLVSLANLVINTGPGYASLPEILAQLSTDGRCWQVIS